MDARLARSPAVRGALSVCVATLAGLLTTACGADHADFTIPTCGADQPAPQHSVLAFLQQPADRVTIARGDEVIVDKRDRQQGALVSEPVADPASAFCKLGETATTWNFAALRTGAFRLTGTYAAAVGTNAAQPFLSVRVHVIAH